MTVSRPGSKPRSERAQEQIGSLTFGVLGSQLAFLERRALYDCRLQASSRYRPIARPSALLRVVSKLSNHDRRGLLPGRPHDAPYGLDAGPLDEFTQCRI
jgi:hypothetical protein